MCKEKSSRFVLISSNDRKGTSTNTNSYTVQLDESIQTKQLSLVSSYIPNTIYNITSSNNTIYFNDGANKSATVSPGAYSVSALMSALGSAMTTASTLITFTCTYSQTTFKVTITGTLAFTLTLGTNTTNTISKVIGFKNENTGSATSHTGSYALQLNLNFLYLNIKQCSNVNRSTNGIDYSFVIPINSNSNEMIQYFENTAFYQTIRFEPSKIFNAFSVELRMQDGQLVELNNSEWFFILAY